MTESAPRGLEFPGAHPVKAMGRAAPGFQALIVDLVAGHGLEIDPESIRSTSSSAGKFESVTLVVQVENRAQLEAIYQSLGEHESVLWTL